MNSYVRGETCTQERISAMIHLYYGDGKGKTSAALGLLLRASGAGLRVALARFLKDDTSAELIPLRTLPYVSLLPSPKKMKFLWEMTEEEKAACAADTRRLFEASVSQDCDVLILDEVTDAVNSGLLQEEALLSFLDRKPENMEVILTGREPSDSVKQRADYITQFLSRRHPYDQGFQARRGIEY